MKIVLVGANGQLGTDLAPLLGERFDLICLGRAELDIADAAAVEATLSMLRPELVINTAAYNRVDDCELETESALRVNAAGPHHLARGCEKIGARILHISTDYVFSGVADRAWQVSDCPHPVSMYGVSKLAGETAVRAACPDSHYVIRVSGLFGLRGCRAKARGGNFVETMLRLQSEGRAIRVVNDQTLSPTSTGDLARKLLEFIEVTPPTGTYHMTSSGSCTWYEFARAIFDVAGLPVSLAPQSSEEAGYQARRPRYSVLSNSSLRAIGLEQIRPWFDGLVDYLGQRALHPVHS